MKTIKCIISVLLGLGLGLLSACVGQRPVQKPPPQTNTNTNTNSIPGKQEDLPVRRPMLE